MKFTHGRFINPPQFACRKSVLHQVSYNQYQPIDVNMLALICDMCYTQNLTEVFWCFCFLFEYGQAVLSFFYLHSVSPVIKTWNRFLNSFKILMVCRAFHWWHLWLWKRRNAFWRHSTTSLCINILVHSRETYLGSLTFKKFLTYSC